MVHLGLLCSYCTALLEIRQYDVQYMVKNLHSHHRPLKGAAPPRPGAQRRAKKGQKQARGAGEARSFLVQSYTPVSFCLWVILFTRLSSRRHILTSYLPATSVISSLVRTCVPSQAPLTRCTLYVWASKEYVVRGHGSSVAGPIYIP